MVDNGYFQGGQVVLDRAKAAQDMRKAQADFTNEQQKRQRAAALNAVNMLRSARDRGGDVGAVFDQLAPVLPKLGVDANEIVPLRQQIVSDPKILDDLYMGLADPGDIKTSGTIKEAYDANGNLVFVKDSGTGGLRPLEGFTPAASALRERQVATGEGNLRQRWVMGQPDFKGEVASAEGYGKKMGEAQGATAAEDLPKSAAAARSAGLAFANRADKEAVINEDIDTAIRNANFATAGLASLSAAVPGTPAADLREKLSTIYANIGFDQLQAMRDASKTGGALGQVSDTENKLLQAVWGSVAASQSPEQLRHNLIRLKQQRAKSFARVREAYKQDYGVYPGEALPSAPRAGSLAPGAKPAAGQVRRKFNPATGRLE